MTVLNYKLLKGHYKEEWGEHDDRVTNKVKHRERLEAKRIIQEELMEMQNMVAAYLIINETTYVGTDSIAVEPVVLFGSLQGALDWLQDVAIDNDFTIEPDASSVAIPGTAGTGIEWDEYYIAEMELKD